MRANQLVMSTGSLRKRIAMTRGRNREIVRVLVLGEQGCGKTTLVQTLLNGGPISSSPAWTIGCNVEVMRHTRGSAANRNVYIEFIDIGGHQKHKSSRFVFFELYDGIIFVSDLTSRTPAEKSFLEWMKDVKREEHGSCPILFVGTKADLVSTRAEKKASSAAGPAQVSNSKRGAELEKVATENGAQMVVVCANLLDPSTSAWEELERFLDKVVERKARTSSDMDDEFGGPFRRRESSYQQFSDAFPV